MKTKTLIKVAGASISKNKMRTMLTMLGIIIGAKKAAALNPIEALRYE